MPSMSPASIGSGSATAATIASGTESAASADSGTENAAPIDSVGVRLVPKTTLFPRASLFPHTQATDGFVPMVAATGSMVPA